MSNRLAVYANTIEFEQPTAWSCVADEVASAGSETILFVEDEAFVREVTCEVLRSAGYRVLPAKNAVEAVRVYDQYSDGVGLGSLHGDPGEIRCSRPCPVNGA